MKEPFPQSDNVYFNPEFKRIREAREKKAKKRLEIDKKRRKLLEGSIIDNKIAPDEQKLCKD